MKSVIRFLSLAMTLGAFAFLSGCYTQLATVHDGDEGYDSGAYQQQQYDDQDSSQAAYNEDLGDYYDQPRYNVGFSYYYPWRSSLYWGYGYDPWWGGFYDPWYYGYSWYSPWRFSAYNSWYSPYFYGGYYPGYYSYYQPYVVQSRGAYVHRGSGYSRTGRVREGYSRTGTYQSSTGSLPNAGRYTTTRGASSSRSGVAPQRNRSTQTGVTRGSSGRSRAPASGRSNASPSRRSGTSSGHSRSSGATRGHDRSSSYSPPARSYSPPPARSYSPPRSSSSGSRGSSSSRGSNRSSGSSRGHR